MRALPLLLWLGACAKPADAPAGTLRGMIMFPPHDTIPFELAAVMYRCNVGHAILLEATSLDGSGVLLRIRSPDSLPPDSLPVIFPTDTATKVGASVAVRYFVHDTPHSTALDSGSVHLQHDSGGVAARIVGSGLENAIRTPTRLQFRNVPWTADTVSCNYAP